MKGNGKNIQNLWMFDYRTHSDMVDLGKNNILWSIISIQNEYSSRFHICTSSHKKFFHGISGRSSRLVAWGLKNWQAYQYLVNGKIKSKNGIIQFLEEEFFNSNFVSFQFSKKCSSPLFANFAYNLAFGPNHFKTLRNDHITNK